MIRLFIADDHRMFREALCNTLQASGEFTVIGEAGSVADTLQKVEDLQPDMLLLDIAFPDGNGIEVVSKLSQRQPDLPVVALSGYSDQVFLDEMLQHGARAYVLKSSGADELLAALRAVINGHLFLSPELMRKLLNSKHHSAAPDDALEKLGPREIEVLTLIANGARSSEIAIRLGIAISTVEVHRRNIRRKLGLQTTAQLTRFAIQRGLARI
ncbi:response regulator transcription factor [Burkholderiaceae bacterium DAT-1]|nr:response regulator transcription factor [Burkholderiaceae bacterium DAT-1]